MLRIDATHVVLKPASVPQVYLRNGTLSLCSVFRGDEGLQAQILLALKV